MMCTILQQVRKSLKFLNRSSIRVISLATILFFVVGFAKAQPGFVVDKIISKVDNYIVLKSELDKAYLEYVSNGGQGGDRTRCQYLAILLRNKLMMAKAEIDSIVVSDDEVDANTERRMSMIMA